MRILLATEGSEFSRAAVEKFCEMFGASDKVELLVVSAAEPTYVPAEPFAISAEYIQEANRFALEKAKSALAEADQQIRSGSPALASGFETRILDGEPEQVIVEEAEKWGADLIIVGSHGYGFWNRTFLGSVSNAVMHHAPCSVLVVRKKPADSDRNGKPS
jgi:nucleotide-binding universal stress UspA family protein